LFIELTPVFPKGVSKVQFIAIANDVAKDF
jgi:hypothetical protein